MSAWRTLPSAVTALWLGVAAPLGAHDFWLQPQSWQGAPEARIGLTLQVGHGSARQRSLLPAGRIVRFEAVASDGRRVDLRHALHVGAPADDADARFAAPGIYSIVLETDNRAESHLSASRFNEYLQTEGLTPALALRARTGRIAAEGAENYSRHARTFLTVGQADEADLARAVRAVGLRLEIVPGVYPPAVGRGGSLPVQVLYRGEPLAGALVKFNDLDHDAQPVEMHRSDSQGRAAFMLPGKGSWQLNVIWTEPQPDGLNDFDTSFSSLSFGTEH